MTFDYSKVDLPVKEIVPEVLEHLKQENTLIINAPAGAGKSTLLPLTFLGQPWVKDKKIIVLEPRRLAAKSIASRLAYFLDEPVGKTVGYRIRFETKVSEDTKIEVITEGILTRMLHSDQELKDVAVVVFDEFHERSIHADVSLALCRESQQILRPDLRIVVMSATLDMPNLSQKLNCQTVQSDGRLYPVDISYTGDTEPITLPEQCAKVTKDAALKHDGDILVFLPGQWEIHKVEEILRKTLRNFIITPLYGSLPMKKQQYAILPDKQGRRKVVLATSIAETSLTIEGIKVVIDSGFGRKSKFDPNSGLSRLETVKITKDTATQRAGRAGRLSNGYCYRMWTKATHERLIDHLVPEIENADLAPSYA